MITRHARIESLFFDSRTPAFFSAESLCLNTREAEGASPPHGCPDSRQRGRGGGVRQREGGLTESRSVVPGPDWASASPGDCLNYKSAGATLALPDQNFRSSGPRIMYL